MDQQPNHPFYEKEGYLFCFAGWYYLMKHLAVPLLVHLRLRHLRERGSSEGLGSTLFSRDFCIGPGRRQWYRLSFVLSWRLDFGSSPCFPSFLPFPALVGTAPGGNSGINSCH